MRERSKCRCSRPDAWLVLVNIYSLLTGRMNYVGEGKQHRFDSKDKSNLLLIALLS